MSQRTVLNEAYQGLVDTVSIPIQLHERDGKKYASFGDVVPIHCCTKEENENYSRKTLKYCGIFSEGVLAPLHELVYAFVRLDETSAEKVFINRTKRLLLLSSDGRVASWRCAPTFESANQYIAGTPIVNSSGALVSMVTAKKGRLYAVTTLDSEGGYFETSLPWQTVVQIGDSTVSQPTNDGPVLYIGRHPKLALRTNGRNIVEIQFNNVFSDDVEYL